MSIKPLSKDAVHQICSSQVITNLSTPLKELIENSLDAQATAIEVYLENYGSECIEVVDNGNGISPENFGSICLKHYTCKLSEFSDLQELDTFGFRGEALSSMCAVGDVQVVTRHLSEEIGSCLEYGSAGELVKSSPCAVQGGTRVSIRNIFSTLPVRRIELMKNLKKEYNKLLQVLYGYCLVRCDVKFQCFLLSKKGKQLVINTTESDAMKDSIVSIFGPKSAKSLIPITKCSYSDVQVDTGSVLSQEIFLQIELSGYISSPEPGCGRCSGDRQFFFLNSRPCDHPSLSRLLNEIYREYDKKHFPAVILNLNTKANQLDVNLTPDKRSILLHSEAQVFLIVRASIVKLFDRYKTSFDTSTSLLPHHRLPATSSSPLNTSKLIATNTRQERAFKLPRISSPSHRSFAQNLERCNEKINSIKFDLSFNFRPEIEIRKEYSEFVPDHYSESIRKETVVSVDIDEIRKGINRIATPSNSKYLCNFSARINPEQNEKAESELRKELSKDSFGLMEVVGQFNLGFIVTKLGSHLFIIDQHATDEKFRFETLKSEERIVPQPLMAPLGLELSVATESVVMDNLDIFVMNGFGIVFDENSPPTNRLKLSALPMSKGWIFGQSDVEEMSLLLEDRPGVLCRPSKIRAMFASRACRSAVMIGTALTMAEMGKIVRNMAGMDQPWQCPHGRPTMRYLISLNN